MSLVCRPCSRSNRLRVAGAAIVLLVAVDGPSVSAGATEPIDTTDAAATETATADAPSALRGLVLDADGRPLPGATVSFKAIHADDNGKSLAPKPTITRTGTDGRFSTGDTVANRFDVRIQAAGYAFQIYRELDPTRPLTVTLDRGRPLTGRVLAETTGHGIADVHVQLDDSEAFDLAGTVPESSTDSEGRYLFAHAPAGTVWVRATAPGWARRSIRGEVRPATAKGEPIALDDLWLPRGGRVSGRVADTAGRPVAGASVVIAAVDTLYGGHRNPFPPMRTRTDEAGRYEFDGVTAGTRYRVTAVDDRFTPAAAGPLTIDAGTVRDDVDLNLRAGAVLRVRLVDAEDHPCTEVTLRFESEEDARTDLAFQQWVKSTQSGGIEAADDGWLTVRRLSPGRYSVRLEPDGWVDIRRESVVLTEAETTDLGTLDLEPGSVMHGRVVDGGEGPVAGAELAVRWQDLDGRHERRAPSDQDGRFSIGGLPGFALTLRVSAGDFADRNLENVTAGADEVVVTLVRRGGIRGTVRLAEGGIPPSFTVRAYTDRGDLTPSPKVETATGTFEISDLDPDAYSVEIRASGKASGLLRKVKVRPGETTDAGKILLQPGFRLEGRVVMADGGAAVAGASVRIDRGAGPSNWTQESGQFVAVSDAQGRFVFDGLDSGRFTLTLFHPGFAPVRRSVDLDPAVRESEIEIGLTGGGEIRGIVVDADGLPVAGADVVIFRGTRGDDLRMTSTLDDGSFHFPRLAAGTYFVLRNRSRARSPFDRQVRTVEVREGQVTRVEFAARDR